jgi:hypothetical protein
VAGDAVYWLENLGAAVAFDAPSLISNSVQRASSLAIRDFDLDGDLDLATSSYGESQSSSGELAWFENLGGGMFEEKRVLAGGLRQSAFILAADFNGNGWPDIAGATWLGGEVEVYRNQLDSPSSVDCDANGVPDECDIAAGAADCDLDGVLDTCEISTDPSLDIDGDLVLDACESIGARYCSPAVVNSTDEAGVLTVLGNEVIFLNNVKLTARALPSGSFGFFITSLTQGFTPNVPNSQGALCVQGSVGRFVGPGQIQSSGTLGAMALDINLNAHPTPTGLIAVLPGETWNYQLWYRDAVSGQTTSNFTDAVAVTFQ